MTGPCVLQQHPHVSQCASAHEQRWQSTKLRNLPTHPKELTPPPQGRYLHFSQNQGKTRPTLRPTHPQTHPPSPALVQYQPVTKQWPGRLPPPLPVRAAATLLGRNTTKNNKKNGSKIQV